MPATGEEPCALSSNKDPAQPKLNGFKNKIHTDAEKLLLRKRGDGVRCRVIKQQPGLSVSKEPLIVWRSEDSLRVSGEGLSKQQSKTLQTRPQSQLGLVWSGVPGGWGVEEKVESVRSGALRGCEKGFGFAKGIFHARMGTIKDRTGMDPREAEDIKKRCQEYTELH